MNKTDNLNIEMMFNSLMTQANAIINTLKSLDPTTEAYGVALNNLAKTFAILGGSGAKDGK